MAEAVQNITFQLDETGGKIKSSAHTGAFGIPKEPFTLVFDEPFLVTVWRKGARMPYLAAWVASPEGLVPFDKKKSASGEAR